MASLLGAPLLFLAALVLAGAVNSTKPPHLLGGIMDANANEKGVQRALDFALSEYNKASNDKFHSRMVQLVGARKQIVSGVNYFLDIEIGRTTCTKSQPSFINCPFHDQPHLQKKVLCSFQIHTVPWLDTISMTKFNCQNA
ncbi:cystatin-C-like [Rhynchocyon petersi]